MSIKQPGKSFSISVIGATLACAAGAAVLSSDDFTGWETRVCTEYSAGAGFSHLTNCGNPDDYVFIENFSQVGIGTGSFVVSGVLMPDLAETDPGTWT